LIYVNGSQFGLCFFDFYLPFIFEFEIIIKIVFAFFQVENKIETKSSSFLLYRKKALLKNYGN